jgi:hypothetical protein
MHTPQPLAVCFGAMMMAGDLAGSYIPGLAFASENLCDWESGKQLAHLFYHGAH